MAGPRLQGSSRRPWQLPVSVLVVFLVTWWLTTRSWFFTDDFLFANFFDHYPISVETLTRSWFGHLMPGYILAAAGFLKVAGLSWPVAGLIIAIIHAGAFLALVSCLDATVGARRLNVAAGFAFVFSVAVLATGLWWAATLNNVTALTLCLSTMGCLTRWVRTGRTRHLVACLLIYALAVAFSEKSLLFSVYAVLWCVLVVWRDLSFRSRMWEFVRRWPAWVGIGLISLVDVVAFVSGQYVAESGQAASLGFAALFVGWGLLGGFVPSLFGADLSLLDPWWGPVVVVLSCAVVAGLVIATVRRNRRAAGVWIFVAISLVMNQAVLSRRADLLTVDGGKILRYHIENTALFWLGFVVVVCTAWPRRSGSPYPGARPAVTGPPPSEGQRPSPPRRRWKPAATILLLLSAGLWVPSVYTTVSNNPGWQSRKWVDTLAASWPGDPAPPFLRFALPCCFTLSGMYPYNMSDYVLPLLHPDAKFTATLEGAWIVGVDGVAGPAQFTATSSAAVGVCLAAGEPYTVPSLTAEPYYFFVRVNYSADQPAALTVSSGLPGDVTISPGTGSVVEFQPTGFGAGTLTLTAQQAPVCVDSVDVGLISVAPSGR